jgi:hypothetical protein
LFIENIVEIAPQFAYSVSESLKQYAFGLVLGFTKFFQVFQGNAQDLAQRFDQSAVLGLFATGKRGSPIKRTEVKRKYSSGPENQVFSPREKPLDNTSDFFAFCLSRNINFAMSAYFAAPVTHQDLGCRSSPTVLRRPDNLRSRAMSKVLLQISWL